MKAFLDIARRELRLICGNATYWLSLFVLPLLALVFFTTIMGEGVPEGMPVGVVDQDNTVTSRAIVRRLDAMQTSRVATHYATVAEARTAVQRGEIYAFLYIPHSTTDRVLASRQPRVSFYYSNTSLTAGSLLYKDMKTVCTLANAAVGQATLRAKGCTDSQTLALLQPIAVDLHAVRNPTTNYNLYLSTMLVPACLMLFVMLLTTYTLGMELKRGTGSKLLAMAGGSIVKAVAAKLLPLVAALLVVMYAHEVWLYGVLGFTHEGGVGWLMAIGLLAVLAGVGFGIFIFGLMPQMRLAMSICSLWGVLSFSMVGAAFPAFAMDTPLQALVWLFPVRHYWMVYALNVFNGFPLASSWPHVAMLALFALLPLTVLWRVKRAWATYVYTK